MPFKGRMFLIHFPMIQVALYVESGKQLVEFELDNIAPEWNMDIAQDAEGNWVPKDNLEL